MPDEVKRTYSIKAKEDGARRKPAVREGVAHRVCEDWAVVLYGVVCVRASSYY